MFGKDIDGKSSMERLMSRYQPITYFTENDIQDEFICLRYNLVWKAILKKIENEYNRIHYEYGGESGITVYGKDIKIFRIKDLRRKYINDMLRTFQLPFEITNEIIHYL